MDAKQSARIIQQRLGLEDQEFSLVRENPKFQRLFENATKGARYRLVAEVVESKGCHSEHRVGQKLFFDSSGNLLTRECPERICAFLNYALLLFGTLGMMIMVSSNHFVTIFIGLEVMSIAIYVLCGLLIGNPRSAEASLKYF
ncbi:MAG: proton-conducting transporter membrane subunit, partial [Pseudomonadota bacterium]